MNIAVAGTGYVGLSIATLLAQHHQVIAVDVVPEKVDLIKNAVCIWAEKDNNVSSLNEHFSKQK